VRFSSAAVAAAAGDAQAFGRSLARKHGGAAPNGKDRGGALTLRDRRLPATNTRRAWRATASKCLGYAWFLARRPAACGTGGAT
jgi:hypothetical protein